MFRLATPQNTRSARPQTGNIYPLAVPQKGLNARDTLAVMGPEYAINLTNVIVESYGLRTRKGYTEWARNLSVSRAVNTVMSYYPATVSPALHTLLPLRHSIYNRLVSQPRALSIPPAGQLFAATDGSIFDVTAGGVGPWVAQVGVAAPSANDNYWTWINFQNLAGSFLTVCNNAGGYAYYNGAAWTTPTMGAGAGQIDGVDPADLVYVMSFKRRLWFIEKQSTSAWFLPVSQITGLASEFNFGEQFRHGGLLAELLNFTIDGGNGPDDYLVAISSQGDVVIYKGIDPTDATDFQLVGVWYVGALPVGRRACINTGADVHILSQYGITPLSTLLAVKDIAALEHGRSTYLIGPLVARLMRDFSSLPGWEVRVIPKEEIMLIRLPDGSNDFGGQFFSLKIETGAWSVLSELPYVDFANIDADSFAGTLDGRVVRAFDGPLDNVLIGEVTGTPIICQVTPAFQPMGAPGTQKVFKLVRPTFIATQTPAIRAEVLVDYGQAKSSGFAPILPSQPESHWDEDLWDVARWSGVQDPIHEWIGCNGVGFVGTAQFTYKCGGDTVLASIDFWTEQGGVM